MAEAAPADPQEERPAAPVTPLKPQREQPPQPKRRWGRLVTRGVLLVAVPVAIAVVGAYYWVTGGRFIDTDNAYVRADMVAISPEVSGRVTEVAVSTNDTVLAGDELFRIDNEPFQIELSQADAQLNMVRTEIEVLRANYRQKQEQVALAETDAAYYRREFNRQVELAERKVVSNVKVDQARHALDIALQQVAVRDRELGEILAKLGGDPETPSEEFARFLNALSKRDRAARELRNAVVRAPADGIVGRVALRPGTFVEPGKPVISVVETADLWLEANLKESDLTHVTLGQPATVTVDAYPDHEWQAKVVSFSPATGAEFSLLPSQNATGNWVKVVQRVPVRLRIERAPDDPPLRVGMSATVSIDTGHKRPLPAFAVSALGWLVDPE
jgi:membrane fusion protein (multidrug efflux system)